MAPDVFDGVADPGVDAADAPHVFDVTLANRASVDFALARLAKRAARKGLPAFTWSWGRAVTRRELVPHPRYGGTVECWALVSRIPLTIDGGRRVCFAGWSFVATLQHVIATDEGGAVNIVRALPGETVATDYRTRGPVCDHCQAVRRRADTFLVRHDDGRVMQVGRTCLTDFLGSDEALKIAASACIIAEARGIAEGGCEGVGGGAGGARSDTTLEDFLPFVAWLVRDVKVCGWVSKTASRERDVAPTAAVAWDAASMPADAFRKLYGFGVDVTDDDRATAEAACAWAEAITDDTIAGATGDYLHNVRTIAQANIVDGHTVGIAASIVVAYQRAIGAEVKRAARAAAHVDAHVGAPGADVYAEAVVDVVTGWEGFYGYTTLVIFRATGRALGSVTLTPKAIDAVRDAVAAVPGVVVVQRCIDGDRVALEAAKVAAVTAAPKASAAGVARAFDKALASIVDVPAGATIAWKTSGKAAFVDAHGTGISREHVGRTVTVHATVKAHDEYKGRKQTKITRAAVRPVEAS